MPDYKNGKIYQLVCNDTCEVYIGSTALSLEDRLSNHKRDRKRDGKRDGLCCSKQIIDRGNYYIELLQNYPCNSRCELEQKEGEYQRANECINRRIAGRTGKEWNQDNKEWVSKRRKAHKKLNKEKLDKQNAEYRRINRESIKLKVSEIVVCECGCEVQKYSMTRHKLSKRHIDLMNKLNLS